MAFDWRLVVATEHESARATCSSCGNQFKDDSIDMGFDFVFCPVCYIAYRIHETKEIYGVELDEKEIKAAFEGRKHIADILGSRGFK